MDNIAVLVLCYNEPLIIGKVISDFRENLPGAVIYVYNNNSMDETVAIAENLGAVVRHEYQQGKGNAIRRMFQETDAEVYIMADGDDTYPVDVAPRMVELVRD